MKSERLLKVIISPHVSEKTTTVSAKAGQYVFKVSKTATKAQVKDAIEYIFNKKVKNVQILNAKPKKKIFRGIQGKHKGIKKAYVTLFPGEKLDINQPA